MFPSILAFVYLLNTVLMWILVKGFARMGDEPTRPLVRIVVLSLLLFLDACFLLWVDCSPRAVAYVAVVFCAAATAFPEGLTAKLSRALQERRFATYALSVFTTTTIFCLHLPITTFLTSPGELDIHLNYLVT